MFGTASEFVARALTGIQCLGNETSIRDCPINATAAREGCFPSSESYASVSCFNNEIAMGRCGLEGFSLVISVQRPANRCGYLKARTRGDGVQWVQLKKDREK